MFNKTKIVCLCGSTKFYDEFLRANALETFNGNIVLSVGYFGHQSWRYYNDKKKCLEFNLTDEVKIFLDELHKKKIDMADEILVIDCDGYIGESTKSEIKYAEEHNKIVRYYSQDYNNNTNKLS